MKTEAEIREALEAYTAAQEWKYSPEGLETELMVIAIIRSVFGWVLGARIDPAPPIDNTIEQYKKKTAHKRN